MKGEDLLPNIKHPLNLTLTGHWTKIGEITVVRLLLLLVPADICGVNHIPPVTKLLLRTEKVKVGCVCILPIRPELILVTVA